MKNTEEISKNISRIIFEGEDARIKKFYPGLKFSGKSYSVTSLQNHVSRYYTISNCMGKNIYQEYLRVFQAALNSTDYKRKYNSVEEYKSQEDNQLELVMKFYEESKNGISRQVFNSVPADQYFIHGPIGTGFGFETNKATGLNIIF